MEASRPVLLHVLRLSFPRARRVAAGLWIAFGVVLWNVVFDHEVEMGAKDYVYRQHLHTQGRGPRVSIDGIMRPAAVYGLEAATGWSVLATGIGLVGVAVSRRHNP